MGSINKWLCSGRLSSDAVELETGSGFECLMHVNVGAGNGETVWAAVYWRGKKAEAAFDVLLKGTLVFVEGALGHRVAGQSGAIIVNASCVDFNTHE